MSGFGGATPGDGTMWLLKVPKELAGKWADASVGTQLAAVAAAAGGETLSLRVEGGRPPAYDLARSAGADCRAFARVRSAPRKRPADGEAAADDDAAEAAPAGERVGAPAATFAMKPAAGLAYRRVCRARMLASNSSTRTTRVVDAAEVPRADRAPVRAFAPAAKDDGALPPGGGKGAGAKRTALPRAALRSKLFGILSADRDSESAALSLKDVNAALGDDAQPEAHLKDVLGEIAAPVRVSGKVHYDLKPEYKDHTAAGS